MQQQFKELLGGEGEASPPSETAENQSQPPQGEPESPEPPVEEPASEEPTEPEEPTDPEEPPVEGEDAEQAAAEAAESDLDTRFAFRSAGEDVELSVSELIKAHQQHSGTKMERRREQSALALARNEFQAQRQTTEAAMKEQGERLTALIHGLESLVGEDEATLNARRQSGELTTEEYFLQKEQSRERNEKIAKAREEQMRLLAQVISQRAPYEQAAFLQKIPEWSDESVAKEEAQKVRSYATEVLGFTPEELQGLVDHRVLAAIVLASRQNQLIQARPVVEKKVRRLPKVVKPGTRSERDPQSTRTSELRARLKKTGGQKEAHAAFKDIFQREEAAQSGRNQPV